MSESVVAGIQAAERGPETLSATASNEETGDMPVTQSKTSRAVFDYSSVWCVVLRLLTESYGKDA